MAKKGVGGGFIPNLGVVLYPRPLRPLRLGQEHSMYTGGDTLWYWTCNLENSTGVVRPCTRYKSTGLGTFMQLEVI